MKLALAMIVKGTAEEAKCLDTCLSYVAKEMDGIFITATYTDVQPIAQEIRDVCSKYNCFVSEYKWIDDFSAARNYNFSQVPKEYDYILWLDADDAVKNVENIKPTIEGNLDVDAFVIQYVYSKNPPVAHDKTQIVKNDGTFSWADSFLHEDLKANRNIIVKGIEGVQRIHLSNEDRFSQNKERNMRISLKQVNEMPDDPRSWWNAGMSCKGLLDHTGSIKYLSEFIKLSSSNDEKYLAKIRIAESYLMLGDHQKAIDYAEQALGMKPIFPDAYNLLGVIYAGLDDFKKGEEYLLQGLQRSRNLPVRSMIVYNPRDYDFTPLKMLGNVYFMWGKPKHAKICFEQALKIVDDEQCTEYLKSCDIAINNLKKGEEIAKKLEKAKTDKAFEKIYNTLTPEQKAMPHICLVRNNRFIKKESTGKDITIFCGQTAEEWTPDTAKTRGIGGSEEAVIWLSRTLVKRGWNVEVYNVCGHEEKVFDGVVYKPFWMWNYRDKKDVTILWRSPLMADYDINTTKLFVDLHDVIQKGEFTEKRLTKIDKIFVKSNCHRALFDNIPDEKFVIVSNGIDANLFSGTFEKDKDLIINTSSPERSLSALIKGFKMIKKQVPTVKCKWAYGWNVFDVVHGKNEKVMEWKKEMQSKMKELGIEEMGRVSHGEVADMYKRASVLAYPSEFMEIDCITLSKSQATGCFPVTTDFAAMGEKQDVGGVFIHSDRTVEDFISSSRFDHSLQDENKIKEWADAVVQSLQNPTDTKGMQERALARFDWERVVDVWESQL